MPTTQFSVRVSDHLYEQFEQLRKEKGENRSKAVEGAIRLMLKQWTNERIAAGCQVEYEENAQLANASLQIAQKALLQQGR